MRLSLTWATFALAYFVVVFGAFVRLSDAGLSCPDWPGCYGEWRVPADVASIARANEAFPDTSLHPGKALVEMIHRYAAGILGLLILSVVALGFRAPRVGTPGFVLGMVLVPAFLFQAGLGMLTVTQRLEPVIVVAHLLGGMIILSLLWSLVLAQKPRSVINWRSRSAAFRLALVGLIAVLVQIALGGWTSANYAALACPDFPTCHGALWPPEAEWRSVWRSTSAGDGYPRLVAIQMVHRLGAVLVACVAVILSVFMWRQGFSRARRCAVFLIGAIAVQWALGIVSVLWRLPLAAAVSHNAMAAMVFLVMTTIFYWTVMKPEEIKHAK